MKLKLLALLVSLFGFAGAVAAPAMAYTVQQEINSGLCAGSNLDIPKGPNPTGKCDVSSASNSFEHFIRKIVNILSAIIGIVAVVMIMFGGFRYVTSGGNDTSVTSAKNTILYAIIGLVIVAMSQILVHFTIKSISG